MRAANTQMCIALIFHSVILCTLQHTPHTLSHRLAESNLQGVVRDVAALYADHGRRAVASSVARSMMSAVAEGPRASEQFAAVAAAFIAGV